MDSGIRSLQTVARLARIAIVAFIAIGVIGIALQLGITLLFRDIGFSTLMTVSLLSSGVSLLGLASLIASIVLVPVWVNQAHANLHSARLEGLTYSPGWATASFFIPFVNCYVPFASTRELYNRSTGKSDWHARASAGDVTSWYACNWGAFVMLVGIIGYLGFESIPGVYVLMPDIAVYGLFGLFGVFTLGSAWFLGQVIGKVTRAQVEMQHVAQSDVFA